MNNLPVITATSELNAALVLEGGAFFLGKGIGKIGQAKGEICFNTSLTGYQEILTDPSYTGQIITFALPHVGNVGVNSYDCESDTTGACGLVVRDEVTQASNFRSESHFNDWLTAQNITGISGVDTREITTTIRGGGACNAIVSYVEDGEEINIAQLLEEVKNIPLLSGQDLASEVSCKERYTWEHESDQSEEKATTPYKVVVIDYGVKHNILNSLLAEGLQLKVVPADTKVSEILALEPDGVFLSNGPGDPAATGKFAIEIIQEIIVAGIPVFGICLGHQLLALASGLKSIKMHQGHRGGNHPVLFLDKSTVEITSQNHGFCITDEDLPDNVEVTHISLFDKSVEGLRRKDVPAFSVQYHPESSPGPHDSKYLFSDFVKLIEENKKKHA